MFQWPKRCRSLAEAFADVPRPRNTAELTKRDYLHAGRHILALPDLEFHYFLPHILCLLIVDFDRDIFETVVLALDVQMLDDPEFLARLRKYRTPEAEAKYIARWKSDEAEGEARFKHYDLSKVRAIAEWLDSVGPQAKESHMTSYDIAREYWHYRMELLERECRRHTEVTQGERTQKRVRP